MKCKSVSTVNFRNLKEQKVNFSDTVTVLCGKNAQGKTNILEAVYIFARGRSFRTQHDREIIKFGEKISSVSIECENYRGNSQPVTLSVEIPSVGGKQFYRSGIRLESAAEVIGEFRAVLFAPEHLSLVNEGPGFRRNFLDIGISQLRPVYIGYLSRHNAIVNQRNALLKNAARENKIITNADKIKFAEFIEPWSAQLAAVDAEITVRRREYISRLNGYVRGFFGEMTKDKELPELKYNSSCNDSGLPESLRHHQHQHYHQHQVSEIKDLYTKLLNENIERELKYASTLYGIHKDDINITLNGREARLFGSQGQQRSVALMMKLAEGEISNDETGEYPVFLLDDVMGELDETRRTFVLNELKNRQVIITSCEESLFKANCDTEVIEVTNGSITGGSITSGSITGEPAGEDICIY